MNENARNHDDEIQDLKEELEKFQQEKERVWVMSAIEWRMNEMMKTVRTLAKEKKNWLSSDKVAEFMANINRKFLKFKALSLQPVMAGIEKNHLGRGLNLGCQGGNFGFWGLRRIFLAMCAPTFSELKRKIRIRMVTRKIRYINFC